MTIDEFMTHVRNMQGALGEITGVTDINTRHEYHQVAEDLTALLTNNPPRGLK